MRLSFLFGSLNFEVTSKSKEYSYVLNKLLHIYKSYKS
jgi:hypothetical protein